MASGPKRATDFILRDGIRFMQVRGMGHSLGSRKTEFFFDLVISSGSGMLGTRDDRFSSELWEPLDESPTPIQGRGRMSNEPDFEQLVGLHYGPMYRFALSLTHRESDAWDLTQETFRLWATKGHQLRDSSKVKAWLFTALYRLFLAGQRRQQRFPHQELETADTELPGVDPEQVDRLDALAVVDLLKEVDSPFQAPVALFHLEDYSYNEIAEILEIPLGTVKSRIARGLAQLKHLYRKQAKRSGPPLPEPS